MSNHPSTSLPVSQPAASQPAGRPASHPASQPASRHLLRLLFFLLHVARRSHGNIDRTARQASRQARQAGWLAGWLACSLRASYNIQRACGVCRPAPTPWHPSFDRAWIVPLRHHRVGGNCKTSDRLRRREFAGIDDSQTRTQDRGKLIDNDIFLQEIYIFEDIHYTLYKKKYIYIFKSIISD